MLPRCIVLGALLVAVASPGALVAQDTQPAIIVEVKFAGDKVEFVGKEEKEAFVPKQLGVPQMAGLFFEAHASKEGEVVYAGELADPRELRLDGGPPEGEEQGEMTQGGMVMVENATAKITIPAGGKVRARELVIYRRTSENSESGRTELLRVGL